MESPPSTPPSSPREDAIESPPSSPVSDNGTSHFPASPASETRQSASMVDVTPSATRNTFMSAFSLSHMNPRDDITNRDISQTTQRTNLPRGDLGVARIPFNRLQNAPSLPPTSPASSHATARMQSQLPASPSSHQTSVMAPNSPASMASASMPATGEENLRGAVVWGTTVSVNSSMQRFRQFVREFRVSDGTDDDNFDQVPYYLQVLDDMHDTQYYHVAIDCQHLLEYRTTRSLYEELIRYPQVLIQIFDMVIAEEYQARFPDVLPADMEQIQVRVFNLRDVQPLRDLNPNDIDELISIRGMVVRCSSVIPDLKQAFFQCSICRNPEQVDLVRGRINEPTICSNCDSRMTMQLLHNRCYFTDKQMIKMQETPDAIPEGETPHTVTLFCFDDLVDAIRPGDKVEVTGIFRAVPFRVTQKQRVVKSIFKTYIDVVYYRVIDGASNRERAATMELDDENNVTGIIREKINTFKAMAQDPCIYDKLANSLAPSIWEMDDVKKGILCQLFGGCTKIPTTPEEKEKASRQFRGDINILLCGDPGTSKSQLLSYVHRIAPRGIYTSGKGSSAVGLTASILRDTETGNLVLESGALVLSDQGVCCIDEFDKMSDSARAVLHEVMEQQTVSIAKAGIICSLNARTSILASANPIGSRYNPNMSVIENINILPTLLSRFDLIYLVIDRANPETDRRLAKHIVSLYFEQPTVEPPPMSMKMLSEYIAYARQACHPKISDEAGRDLVDGYLKMRNMGANRNCITATPRQLESLIRIAEAHARIRLADAVETYDVAEALRLMNVATQQAAMDPRTGTIDMEMLTTGRSAMDREAMEALVDSLRSFFKEGPGVTTLADLRKVLEDQSQKIKPTELDNALRVLTDDRTITMSRGTIKVLK